MGLHDGLGKGLLHFEIDFLLLAEPDPVGGRGAVVAEDDGDYPASDLF
jgi:hypothetical protein